MSSDEADLPAATWATEELRQALETWAEAGKRRYLCLHDFLLLTAIERTPGLQPAHLRVTDAVCTLPGEWWA